MMKTTLVWLSILLLMASMIEGRERSKTSVYRSHNCQYSCHSDGRCDVSYIEKHMSGASVGKCLPLKLGGRCSEILEGCESCHSICNPQNTKPSTPQYPTKPSPQQYPLNLPSLPAQHYPVKPPIEQHQMQISFQPMKPHIQQQPVKPPKTKLCEYSCKPDGGCKAKYIGPSRDGPSLGACFPLSFAEGKCFDIPEECEVCHDYCSSSMEPQPSFAKPHSQPISMKTDSQQYSLNLLGQQPLINTLIQHHLTKPPSHLHPINPSAGDLCEYSCQSNGGCSAKYTGPFRTGPQFGSCFPLSHGGKCFGMPPECQACHKHCTSETQNHEPSFGGKPTFERNPTFGKNLTFATYSSFGILLLKDFLVGRNPTFGSTSYVGRNPPFESPSYVGRNPPFNQFSEFSERSISHTSKYARFKK